MTMKTSSVKFTLLIQMDGFSFIRQKHWYLPGNKQIYFLFHYHFRYQRFLRQTEKPGVLFCLKTLTVKHLQALKNSVISLCSSEKSPSLGWKTLWFSVSGRTAETEKMRWLFITHCNITSWKCASNGLRFDSNLLIQSTKRQLFRNAIIIIWLQQA